MLPIFSQASPTTFPTTCTELDWFEHDIRFRIQNRMSSHISLRMNGAAELWPMEVIMESLFTRLSDLDSDVQCYIRVVITTGSDCMQSIQNHGQAVSALARLARLCHRFPCHSLCSVTLTSLCYNHPQQSRTTECGWFRKVEPNCSKSFAAASCC